MAYLGSPFPSTAELMYIRRVDHLEVQVAALEAERDARRKDAERYRWLREQGGMTWHLYKVGENPKKVDGRRAVGSDYDASVDANMAVGGQS